MQYFYPILAIFAVYTTFKIKQIARIHWLLCAVITLIIFGLMFCAQAISRHKLENIFTPGVRPSLVWSGNILIGLWATFFLLALGGDLLVLLGRGLQRLPRSRRKKEDRINSSRREFLSRGVPTTLLGASATMAGVGFAQAVAGPQVEVIYVPLQNLPEPLRQLRIAQISDLHVGPTIHREYVQSLVEKVQGLAPDLIAVTGDLGDGDPQELAEHLKPLANLKAPLGVFYVTGNHEYYWNVDAWVAAARGLGFIPLLNENKIVSFRGTQILVGGVTDTSSAQYDPAHVSDPFQALKGGEHCDLKLLLAHRPESCYPAAQAGFHLQISGHTHAGQFFPFNLFMPFAHKYYQGLNQYENLWVYVNRGCGYWGPPNRFAIPTEITLLQFQPRPV